ncbi:DUF1102 domain-containing protein [Halorubrum salsamenti]|uniref:DUF1102 domain-containing protein n=1 Tax=Halorubrum salsamenti TaxID=2583990 RepID=UPI00119FE278|nr:DUF1102 domain-containing protein [Halorubrum salsamenti]
MERRKFVVGMGSLAAGGAAAMGTGALSQIRAERNISGEIVADNEAYLKINAAGSATHGFIVEYNNGGEVNLNFGENDQAGDYVSGGEGLNPDAENWFDDAFRVVNTSAEELDVWFEKDSSRIGFYQGAGSGRSSVVGSGNSVTLSSGDAVDLGVYVSTLGLGKNNEGQLFDGDDDFEIHAEPS